MNIPRRSMQIVRSAVALAAALAWSSTGHAQSSSEEVLPAPPAESATEPLAGAPLGDTRSEVELSPVPPSPELFEPGEYWVDPTPGSVTGGALQGPPSDGVINAPPIEILADAASPVPPAVSELFGYDTLRDQTTWLIAYNDRFGWVSFESLPTLTLDKPYGVVGGFGVHFLDGPIVTDMSARLFDFSIGYQVRRRITPNFGLDLVARIGAFSDFKGSAREGVRFPGHAVSFARLSPEWELLLGVDYLDRDDISLLPVFGAVWTPSERVRIDAVFPRPCAAVRVAEANEWLYVRDQLGGGT